LQRLPSDSTIYNIFGHDVVARAQREDGEIVQHAQANKLIALLQCMQTGGYIDAARQSESCETSKAGLSLSLAIFI
jgi:hypothetical protein